LSAAFFNYASAKVTIMSQGAAGQPPLTKKVGTTTTVKSDRYRQVWTAQIAPVLAFAVLIFFFWRK
jgi:hypothetical protein